MRTVYRDPSGPRRSTRAPSSAYGMLLVLEEGPWVCKSPRLRASAEPERDSVTRRRPPSCGPEDSSHTCPPGGGQTGTVLGWLPEANSCICSGDMLPFFG